MSLVIQQNIKLGVRYKFVKNDNDSNIYSGVLHEIIDYPEPRFIFTDAQNETRSVMCGLYSIPAGWISVFYVLALPILPAFLNLEISGY